MTLNEFLVQAKINTYAKSGEGGETTSEDGSKELTYVADYFKYRDRYFGSRFFSGQEIVWQDDIAVWSMNYYGGIIDEIIDSSKVSSFLKEALREVESSRPFRGPAEYQVGEWLYRDNSVGDVNDFSGTEEIYWSDKKVYELKYHGGKIIK